MTHICGLDFGTSNSTLGIASNSQVSMISLENSGPLLPSAIFFNDETMGIQFGQDAIAEYIQETEGRLMRAIKSILGTELMYESTPIHKAELVPFVEILSAFIYHMKNTAESNSNSELTHVTLGRPVHFNDTNPELDAAAQQALGNVAMEAGFKHISFQYEPIAAALDYESRTDSEKRVLIVDIGGGTSDFSIIKTSPKNINKADRADDILANHGVHVGGTDFDRYFNIQEVMPHLGLGSLIGEENIEAPKPVYYDLATWPRINMAYTQKNMLAAKKLRYDAHEKGKFDNLIEVLENRLGHAIAIEVEKSKIRLSDAEDTLMDLSMINSAISHTAVRTQFNKAIHEQVGRVIQALSETLIQAGIEASEIDTAFFTGGSTSIPYVRDIITQSLPNAEIVWGDKFASVGYGLTLDAMRKFA